MSDITIKANEALVALKTGDYTSIEVKKISKVTGYDLDMKPIEVTVWEEV